jgi:TFIIF-interacting CTD phosphatase-like protein
LNGEVFRGLNKLTEIWLSGNICIDENFIGSTRIAVLEQTINQKCNIDEALSATLERVLADNDSLVLEAQLAESNDAITRLEASLAQLKAENENMKKQKLEIDATLIKELIEECKLDKMEWKVEKKQLKSDLTVAKSDYKYQLDLFVKLHNEVKSRNLS